MARIAIVGAGTAGAAAGLFLGRQGHEITVFEAVDKPAAIGAGIMLQPTGMNVLARLSLLEPVLDAGHRIDSLECRSGTRTLFELPYHAWHPRAFGLGLHRGVLFETLFEAVRDELDLRCGIPIESLHGPDGVRDESGRVHAGFDLVIVADGARSGLRGQIFPNASVRPYAWGALWFVADDPGGPGGGSLVGDRLLQRVLGAHEMIGLLPTGRAPGGDHPVVSLFISVRSDRADAIRAEGPEALRARVLRVAPEAEPVLDQLTDTSRLVFARYRDVRLRSLVRDRVVFLGDAAHAMSPQLGQGANLALWDAMSLADCIESAGADMPAALAAFARARKRHLRFYQWMTRLLTPFFQSDSRLLGGLRDVFFPLGARIPWMRRQMVGTMCGVKTGLLSSLPLSYTQLPSPDRAESTPRSEARRG